MDANWVKAYALIWEGYCSKEVRDAIKEMPDYETSIRDKLLVLLEMIQVLMHTPERAMYPPLTLVEVLISFLSNKTRREGKISGFYRKV